MQQPADGVHIRTCPLGEAMCGLRVRVEAGRVLGRAETPSPPIPSASD